MTTITLPRATVEQALEALKFCTPKPRPTDDDYAEQGWKEHNATITALRAALAQQAEPAQQVKTCAWRDNLDAIYETECGNLHIVNDGTLEENGMRYCCYCGKEIKDESPT